MAEWEYLSVRELADRLQLNQQTVRNWINAGEVEFIKVGRAVRIPRRAAVRLAGGDGWEMPELLTVEQVADLLKLNKQTIYNWIDAGTFPFVQLGVRRYRIKRSDLDAFIDGNAYAKADQFWGAAS